jgi:hypothetical protein
MFGKLGTINPDAETDRSLFCFFWSYFIGSGIYAPESCSKNKIAAGYQVPEVPEIVDALRE